MRLLVITHGEKDSCAVASERPPFPLRRRDVNSAVPQARIHRNRSAPSQPDGNIAEIVIIDHEPLRRATAADCAETRARLEKARAGWHRFEHRDKPAFARWRAREFGPLLSRAREVETGIRERQTLVHEVEMEMRRGFQDAHTAYQRVRSRGANPSAVEEETTSPASEGAGKLSEFEQETLFQAWVQKSLGTNPDKMDDAAYSATFDAFKTHMFRSAPPDPQPQNVRCPREQERIQPEPAEEESTPADVRVKELYRVLVRRLHPDLRADGSAAVSTLWHEVQEAYAASDVARMEILLAVTDIGANPLHGDTTLSQMRSVVAELHRALRALEKSLQEAESEDAWDFARTGPATDLRLRVERELKSDLALRTGRLDLLERTIADWARGPIANRRITRPRQCTHAH